MNQDDHVQKFDPYKEASLDSSSSSSSSLSSESNNAIKQNDKPTIENDSNSENSDESSSSTTTPLSSSSKHIETDSQPSNKSNNEIPIKRRCWQCQKAKVEAKVTFPGGEVLRVCKNCAQILQESMHDEDESTIITSTSSPMQIPPKTPNQSSVSPSASPSSSRFSNLKNSANNFIQKQKKNGLSKFNLNDELLLSTTNDNNNEPPVYQSPESPLERRVSIESRAETSLKFQTDTLQQLSQGHIFERFVVVGLPATVPIGNASIRNEPQVLYHYAPDDTVGLDGLSERVRHFCFPDGVETQLVTKTASASSIQEILLSSNFETFTFVLGSNEQQLFGCCVRKVEPLYEKASFMNDNELKNENRTTSPRGKQSNSFYAANGSMLPQVDQTKPNQKEKSSRRLVTTTRCYCLLSRFPYFDLHFDVLRIVLGQERLIKMTEWDQMLTQLQMNEDDLNEQKNENENEEEENGKKEIVKESKKEPSKNIVSSINLIIEYGKSKLVGPGQKLNVLLPGEVVPLTLQVPAGVSREDIFFRLIGEYVLPTVTRYTNLMHLLQLFSAVMVERRVVVTSKKISVLSCVALALPCLIRPFSLKGLFVPLLPAHLRAYLDAPVPFVFGMTTLGWANGVDDCVRLDLDARKLYIPSSITLPKLPEGMKLLNKCKPRYNDLLESTRPDHSPQYNATTNVALAKSLLHMFSEYNQWLVDILEDHFDKEFEHHNGNLDSRGASADYAKERLIKKANSSNRPFLTLLLSTQHFSVWFDAWLVARQMREYQKNIYKT